MRRSTGFALSTALVVIFFVMLAAFAMAGLAAFNYSLAKTAQLDDEALEAARSGLALAMTTTLGNPKWGLKTTDTLPENTIAAPSTDPMQFTVTFSPGTSLPWSVNNLSGNGIAYGPPDTAHQNTPRAVPPHTMLLFVRGQAGQGGEVRLRTLEAVVQFPPSTYAIAASNSIVCWDSAIGYHGPGTGFPPLIVGGAAVGGAAGSAPGSIFAGGSWEDGSPPYSIYLNPESTVSGYVDAAGGQAGTNVVAASPAPVPPGPPTGSAIRDSSTLHATFPTVTITDYDNSATAVLPGTGPNGEVMITGPVHYPNSAAPGPFTPSNPLVLGSGPDPSSPSAPVKPVILEGGTLYVDGCLWMPGGLVGNQISPGPPPKYQDATGSIYVNGQATICLTWSDPTFTGDGVAIFSQGDLSLYPVGWAGDKAGLKTIYGGEPKLVGTVYTHGNITVSDDILLIGAMVASGNDPSTGNIFFAENATVNYLSTFASFGNLASADDPNKPQQMNVLYCREIPTR